MNKKRKYLLITIILLILSSLFLLKTFANETEDINKRIIKDISETQNKIIEEEIATKELKRERDRLRLILDTTDAKKVPIISYGNIYTEDSKDLHFNKISQNNISEEEFKKHMKYLKDNNYYVATLKEISMFNKNELDLPEKTVAIIFESGYQSVLDIAYPILKEYNFYASVFIPGNKIRKYDNKDYINRIKYLNYDDLKKISDVISIETKSYNLYDLEGKESKFKISDDEIVSKDLDLTIDSLSVEVFMYPHLNDEKYHNDLLEKKGFIMGITQNKGYITKDTNILQSPRFKINKNISFEDFKNIINKQ